LALGRRKLSTVFGSSPPRLLEAGELLAGADSSNRIYHLRAGWLVKFTIWTMAAQQLSTFIYPAT
jgi:hypothetical protein